MRSLVVAGIGGLVLGHIVWLLGISLATNSPARSTVVLIVSAVFLLAAAGIGYLAWQRYEQRQLTAATFLAALTVSPVIFTVIVLGVTYL